MNIESIEIKLLMPGSLHTSIYCLRGLSMLEKPLRNVVKSRKQYMNTDTLYMFCTEYYCTKDQSIL